jgi:hypothetical protein
MTNTGRWVVKLNHTILAAHDRKASALFTSFSGSFCSGRLRLVNVGDELTLDFLESHADTRSQQR